MKQHRGFLRFVALLCAVLAVAVVFSRVLGTRRMAQDGGMAVPLFIQSDYDETVCVIAGSDRSVKSSGCGATCMAMAAAYYYGEDDARSPQALFTWAYDNGYYNGNGLGHDCMEALADLCRLRASWTDDNEAVSRALERKCVVVAHMGPGEFTKEGHYIVLRGFNDAGEVLVNDPNSRERSAKAYTLAFIRKELKAHPGFLILNP